MQGLEQGFTSLFNGFEKGFTGLITEPLEGAQKGGFEGFLEGSFKGLAGFVSKPITGMFDGNSKIVESLKNQIQSKSDKQSDSKIRSPRVFYEKN